MTRALQVHQKQSAPAPNSAAVILVQDKVCYKYTLQQKERERERETAGGLPVQHQRWTRQRRTHLRSEGVTAALFQSDPGAFKHIKLLHTHKHMPILPSVAYVAPFHPHSDFLHNSCPFQMAASFVLFRCCLHALSTGLHLILRSTSGGPITSGQLRFTPGGNTVSDVFSVTTSTLDFDRRVSISLHR